MGGEKKSCWRWEGEFDKRWQKLLLRKCVKIWNIKIKEIELIWILSNEYTDFAWCKIDVLEWNWTCVGLLWRECGSMYFWGNELEHVYILFVKSKSMLCRKYWTTLVTQRSFSKFLEMDSQKLKFFLEQCSCRSEINTLEKINKRVMFEAVRITLRWAFIKIGNFILVGVGKLILLRKEISSFLKFCWERSYIKKNKRRGGDGRVRNEGLKGLQRGHWSKKRGR